MGPYPLGGRKSDDKTSNLISFSSFVCLNESMTQIRKMSRSLGTLVKDNQKAQ